MCKIGDIICIESYKSNGVEVGRHSFVVIEDEDGQIEGISYDIVCNVMSSFKNEEQKARKLRYPGNYALSSVDTVTNPDNNKDGYLKTDQLYFFIKDKIQYNVIGNVKPEIMEKILAFIQDSEFEIEIIADNL
ncbi:protein associated with RNAse G/E [Lachnospiraceae bacterium PF1-21]